MTRDERGRFKKGTSGNPNGRPSRATEEEYLGTFKDIIPLDRFARQIEAQAKRADRGDIRAFESIAKFLGLDVLKIDQHNDGELLIRVVYERSNDKTARTA